MQNTTKAGAEMTMEGIGLQLEPDSARKAIVAAARRIAERDGAEALTPETVAEEADCAPEAVRAEFADSNALQLAVVTDDLEELASLMRASADGGHTSDAHSPSPADAELSLKEIQQAIGVVLGDAPDSFEQDFAADTDQVPDAFPDEIPDEPETQVAPHLQLCEAPNSPGAPDSQSIAVSIAELERNMARLEARPVDAWLERRLRVFERTLADIETRMEKVERDSAASISVANDGFKALEEHVEAALKSVTEQADDSGQRQGELRLYINDLSRRLSLVEARRGTDPVESPAPAEWAMPQHEDACEAPPSTDDEAVAADAGTSESGSENYLDAARRAARSAAAAAEKPKRKRLVALHFPEKIVLSLSRRTLHLITSILGAVVLLLMAGTLLKGQAAAPAAAAVAPQAFQMSPDARVVALARAHDPGAALIVGLKFLNGDGVARDLPSAVYWLRVAAKGHEPVAEYWLGTFYERGLGVAENRAQAMQWYEAAATAGNVKAMYRLGVAEVEGWNGEPDYAQGAKWFQAAARLGVVDSEYNLGVLYERGEGLVQSFANAFTWYAIAAGQGDFGSKARLDVLASQLAASDVEAAQKAAAAFSPAIPNTAANEAPTVLAVAQTMKVR